jgi:hypothetical protein
MMTAAPETGSPAAVTRPARVPEPDCACSAVGTGILARMAEATAASADDVRDAMMSLSVGGIHER